VRQGQFGGLALGRWRSWALEAYGAGLHAPGALDRQVRDVRGAGEDYEAIVKGRPGLPARPARIGQCSYPRAAEPGLNVELEKARGMRSCPAGIEVRFSKEKGNGSQTEVSGKPGCDFDRVRISIASPDKIKSWSWGEVTKPETITIGPSSRKRTGSSAPDFWSITTMNASAASTSG